jgi:hypothetical protein
MADLSVRNANGSAQTAADALLRATGGSTAVFLVAPAQGDTSDAGQLGIDVPDFQSLVISPVLLQRVARVMQENQRAKYELLVSATAMAQQLSVLQLSSVDALLSMTAEIQVGGLTLLLEAWSCSVSLGRPVYYRLALRAAEAQSLLAQS